MTRTIGYYLLLLKTVVQMTVFPVLLLRLDQIRIGKFVCTRAVPFYYDNIQSQSVAKHINSKENFTEKDVLAPALQSWDPEKTDQISEPM
jgi:hypothetical protein